MRVDGSLLEIIRNHFSAICCSMCYVIERTSYTTYVTESGDFTAALVTADGRLLMYPKTAGVTNFLGLSLEAAIKAAGGIENLHEGDVVVTNDPYTTDGLSSHLPDIHAFKPYFYEGELVCFGWAFIHSSDIGGKVPTSLTPDATDIQMEGLRIPPVKLYSQGELVRDVRDIILAASRMPDLLLGDINCMMAALATGESKIIDAMKKFGRHTLLNAAEDLIEISEERSRAIISSIPDGTFSFEDYLDDDAVSEIPIRIACDLTIEGSDLTLDFSRSDPQTSTAFNLITNGSHHPFIYQGLINFIISEDPFIPVNVGLTNPIRVVAPRGTVMNAEYPAAGGLRHPVSMRLFSAILGALAQVIPARVQAAGAGQAQIVTLSVPDESKGGVMSAIVVEPLGGGDGARYGADGIDGIDHSTAFLRNTPIETIENRTSIIVERYELVPDTAGPGEFRGGSALRLDFSPTVERSLVGARGQEHLRFEPWGLAGGHAGQLGHSILNPQTQSEQELGKLSMQPLTLGDTISFRTPSGGGWGDPLKRDPQAVVRDVRNRLLSPEKALEDYGVVVAGEGNYEVDEQATRKERAARAAQTLDEKSAAPGKSTAPGAIVDGRIQTDKGGVYDLGESRRSYEQVWTPEASDELARLTRQMPANRRPLRKHQVHEALDGRHRALTANDVRAAWSQFEKEQR